MSNLWDQAPGETSRAYNAFLIYLEMGPTRTHKKVFEKIGGNHAVIIKWSGQWKWQDRIKAFEEAQNKALLDTKIDLTAESQKQVINDLIADYQMMLDDWRKGYEERKSTGVPLTADERIKFTSARKSIDDMIRRAVGLPNAVKEPKEVTSKSNGFIPGKATIKWRNPALPGEIAE